MRLFWVLMVLLVGSLQSVAQNNITTEVVITDALRQKNEVYFTESKLTWDDFKGRPERNVDWTAMTYSGVRLRSKYKKIDSAHHLIKIELYPYMDRSTSWYTEKGHNDYTLAHEQLHFDITILVTMQLAEALRARNYSIKKFSKQVNEIYDTFQDKLRKMQDQYDEQTKHGVNIREQRVWAKKIATEMDKLRTES